jgi:hypothetical protein
MPAVEVNRLVRISSITVVFGEVCMLGNVALRAGKKLTWDGPSMKVTNDEAANRFLRREYRPGWGL